MSSKISYSDQELKAKLQIDQKTLDRFKAIRLETIKQAQALNKKKGKIKVLGISGSARDEFGFAREKSNSEELLEHCLNKCQKLGAETELVALRKMNIKHCQACYSTVNTQCHFYCSCYPKGTATADDMTNILYDKVLAADVIIFATPVNNFKMSTMLATFLDRCISLDGSLSPADPKKAKDKDLNIKHAKFVEMTADDSVSGSGFLRRFAGKTAGVIVTGHEEGAALVISSLFMTLSHYGMIFPPFSNMYAMSSICRGTYLDKPEVTSACHKEQAELLAENLIISTKMSRSIKNTDWKTIAGGD
jgi:multimeric flavodoxin WrbA